MADLTYGEIKDALVYFAEDDVESAPGGALRVVNRAVQFIQDFFDGEWENLLVRDKEVSLDPTGIYVTLPDNFNKLYRVYGLSSERLLEMGDTNFTVEAGEPTDLTSKPTRRIKYWIAQGSGSKHLTYWRKAMLFTSTDGDSQVPDIPNSGETILDVAKWLQAKNERNTSRNETMSLQNDSYDAIRRLKANDSPRFQEFSAGDLVKNSDPFTYENYNLSDGGSMVNDNNPLLDGN